MAYHVIMSNERGSMEDFIHLPFRIYRDDPNWVAPLRIEVARTLDPGKNPYFRGVDLAKFICYRDGMPVARVVAVVNPKHWEKFGEKAAFFGFFESENDPPAVSQLFAAVEAYCASKGATYLEGPFNPNHYSELGLLVENFDPPAFFETYNPPYYASLLRGAGLAPIIRLHTRINRDSRAFSQGADKERLRKLQTDGFTIRPLRLFQLTDELECIRDIYNDAFSENWHFLPVSREEYLFQTQFLFLVTNPSMIQIVEHNGQPVAVSQCALNINPLLRSLKGKAGPGEWMVFLARRFFIRELVAFAVGIKKEYRHSPAVALLMESFRKLTKKYPVIYSTWMSDSNTAAIKDSEKAGYIPYKWFEIFGKAI